MRTKGARVLVIYKKSSFQIYVVERKNPRMRELLEDGDPTLKRLKKAHDEHVKTLSLAREFFQKNHVNAVFRYRSDARAAVEHDLVVTLGGDGTLLWASHLIGSEKPVVAINTAPSESVGYFCAGNQLNIADTLHAALSGKLKELHLQRMQVDLDDKVLSTRVLNDMLFCHSCPASMTRYFLRLDDIEEQQKSSGIWVGPAAGSTAGQKSAGGHVLKIHSTELQYVVREPYTPTNSYIKTKGTFQKTKQLIIRSQIRDGRIFIDGPHKRFSVPMGGIVRCKHSNEPLVILGFKHER